MKDTIIRSRRLRDRRRRVRRERLRRWTRRVTGAALIGALVVSGIAVAGSSLFALDGVDVTGARTVRAEDVRAAAGLRPGQNVLRLDLDGARRRVEAIAAIRHAEVRRAGALRVRILVVERVPAVTVRGPAGTRYFDVDGVEVRGPAKGRLPLVRLAIRRTVVADGRAIDVAPHADARIVRRVLRVWGAFGDLRPKLGAFTVDETGVVARLGTTRLLLGDTTALREKLAAIRSILAWGSGRGVALRSVDVRVPARPALRIA